MTALYKLTDKDGFTRNGTKWCVGVTYTLPKCADPELCTGDVFHVYTNQNLALLLNPIHANFIAPKLFKCEGDVVISDWGKAGCFGLTIIRELDLPEWYREIETRKQVMVQFAILCAESVLHYYENIYSDNRPRKAIEAAKKYLRELDSAADDAAAYAADADAAAYAADADAAAYAAAADAAAYAAAYAAYAAVDAAAYAADAAAYAADAAAYAGTKALDFEYFAELAVKMICG